MVDTSDDQRFREQIEALALAIGTIHGHAAPDRDVLDAIIQQEVERATTATRAGALDSDTITRLVRALERWRDADADHRRGVSVDNAASGPSG